jgi:hypothetical protein
MARKTKPRPRGPAKKRAAEPRARDPRRFTRMTRHEAIARFGVAIEREHLSRQLLVLPDALVALVTLGEATHLSWPDELVWRIESLEPVSPLAPHWLPPELADDSARARAGVALFLRTHEGEAFLYAGRAEPLRWEQDVDAAGFVLRAYVKLGLRALPPDRFVELGGFRFRATVRSGVPERDRGWPHTEEHRFVERDALVALVRTALNEPFLHLTISTPDRRGVLVLGAGGRIAIRRDASFAGKKPSGTGVSFHDERGRRVACDASCALDLPLGLEVLERHLGDRPLPRGIRWI